MGVFKQNFEVLRGSLGSIQGGRFQTSVWPKVTDSLPGGGVAIEGDLGVVQFLLLGLCG